MKDKIKICKHNDGLGHCDVFGGEYCVESPCQHEELIEYVLSRKCRYCKHSRPINGDNPIEKDSGEGVMWCNIIGWKVKEGDFCCRICDEKEWQKESSNAD